MGLHGHLLLRGNMRTRDEIVKQLESPIAQKAIFQRSGAAGTLDYISGDYVIDALNSIFGFDGWSFTHKESGMSVIQFITEGNNKGKTMAIAHYAGELTVHVREEGIDCTRAGAACGSGTSRNAGEAAHFALAEAETDALKRAARLLGGYLGLQLYRKDHGNIGAPPVPLRPVEELPDNVRMLAEGIGNLRGMDEVPALAAEIKVAGLEEEYLEDLRRRMTEKLQTLKGGVNA